MEAGILSSCCQTIREGHNDPSRQLWLPTLHKSTSGCRVSKTIVRQQAEFSATCHEAFKIADETHPGDFVTLQTRFRASQQPLPVGACQINLAYVKALANGDRSH